MIKFHLFLLTSIQSLKAKAIRLEHIHLFERSFSNMLEMLKFASCDQIVRIKKESVTLNLNIKTTYHPCEISIQIVLHFPPNILQPD